MQVFTAYQTCHADPLGEGEAPTSSLVPGGVGKSQAAAITSLLGWDGLHILVGYSIEDLRPLATLSMTYLPFLESGGAPPPTKPGVTCEKLAHRVG